MAAPTAQEYQPLSDALRINPPVVRPPQFQNQPSDRPRLQLAPPEHQKHLQAQAQVRQHQDTTQQPPFKSPTTQRPTDASISSSREVSPVVGVEPSPQSSGQKRRQDLPTQTTATTKKRKTDQPQQQEVRFDLGTHYPYAYAYPGAPLPPPIPAFHPPQAPHSGAAVEMSFNEFQWRLLNLCGEFYEAATELIRSTPHHVLSQAFQLLGRGPGTDPISVLNDARRTCDILLTNPQSLSTAPPPPTALSLPVLTSLAHLNQRTTASSASQTTAPPPSYYAPPATQAPSTAGDKLSYSFRSKEKEKISSNVQGTWKENEVERLKALAEKYRMQDKEEEEEEEEEELESGITDVREGDIEAGAQHPKNQKSKEPGEIDWDKVVAEFGEGRSRHQILIKATYLGLKPSSTLPGKKPKAKITPTSTEPPPPTFSSASAKSIPVGYSPSRLQSPSTTPSASNVLPTGPAADTTIKSKPSTTSTITPIDAPKTVPPQSIITQPPPAHSHAHYPQTGWYHHPQNPYYAYPHPMYYTPPQGYGMQGYGQPQQGYYGQPYPPPPASEHSPQVAPAPPAPAPSEKPKGKRKDKSSSRVGVGGRTAVPPPSLSPKSTTNEPNSSNVAPTKPASSKPASTSTAAATTSTPASVPSTPQAITTTTGTASGSTGILRRGPNNSLFTYTPLPHGPVATTTEQSKAKES